MIEGFNGFLFVIDRLKDKERVIIFSWFNVVVSQTCMGKHINSTTMINDEPENLITNEFVKA